MPLCPLSISRSRQCRASSVLVITQTPQRFASWSGLARLLLRRASLLAAVSVMREEVLSDEGVKSSFEF